MKKCLFLSVVIILAASMMQLSCSAPHYFWPQKNAPMSELNKPSLGKKVLVAARSSEFKDAVVDKVKSAFMGEPVYMKFIGIDQLKKEKSKDYSAMVVINTCMSWGMDRHVKGFLKKHKEDQSRTIVLTTSGDGDWKPKMKEPSFDAISSASKKNKVDEVADEIIAKMRALLQD